MIDLFSFSFSAALSPELLHAVLSEVPPLLSESDLHIAQLTLHLLTSVASLYCPSCSRCLQSMVSYVHRIGRTGRAGRAGEAVTLYTEQDMVRVCSA